MAQKKITIYSADFCPYCVRAKELLKSRGLSYEEIVLAEDDDQAWDALTQRTGMTTVPQIFVQEQLIGGYTELAALDAKDRLHSLK